MSRKMLVRTAPLAAPILLLSAGAVTAAPSLPATPADIAIIQENGAYVLRTDATGLALYTFDRDPPGTSTCNAACAALWPPVLVTPGSTPSVGDWTQIRRDDGERQWAFRGKPVYTFAKDTPGDATGDRLGGAWRLLPPLTSK